MNKKNSIWDIETNEINGLIPEQWRDSRNFQLEEVELSSTTKFNRKRFFKLVCGKDKVLHLTFGKFPNDILEKSKKLYQLLPEIIVKPQFYSADGSFGLFAQDWFEGKSIETLSSIPDKRNDVNIILEKLEFELSRIQRTSTEDALINEFRTFKDEVYENPYLNKNFKSLLNEIVFPSLKEELVERNSSVRWTNGDINSSNILANENNEFKLIDYEFSKETHFHREDWLRLGWFSGKHIQQLEFVKQKIESTDPSIFSYFFLKQILLNKSLHGSPIHSKKISFNLNSDFKIPSTAKDHVFLSNIIYEQLCLSVHIENEIESKINTATQLSAESHSRRLFERSYSESVKQYNILEKKSLDEKKQQENLQKSFALTQQHLLDEKKQHENLQKSFALTQQHLLDEKKQHENLQRSFALTQQHLLDEKKQHENLQKSFVLTQKNLAIYQNKVERMTKSFSWKITQPLRFLRRKFIDPIKHFRDTKVQTKAVQESYQDWIEKYDTITAQKTKNFSNAYKQLEYTPLFSIIIPVYNPPLKFFEEAINSVKSQIYENWEICLADDMSTDPGVHKIIKKHVKQDTRIKAYFNKEHSHISVTSNNALALARGKFVVLMDHDDLLRPHSLLRLAQCYNNNRNIKIIYSDEDKIDESENRSCPYFKPDWNPDLLLAQNYLCHLFCAETALIIKQGGFRQGFEGSQDWDLILRLTEHVNKKEIVHIPEILYHWRIHSGSVADNIDNKSYAVKAAKKAVEEHLTRSKIDAKVSVTQNQFLRVDRQSSIQRTAKASIIIPTKNNYELLKTCIESIFDKTSASLFELIVVDNQTTDSNSISYFSKLKKLRNCKILNYKYEFNYSAINNFAVKHAKNEILIFLNDDTQIISDKWLQELISQAIRPDIGAVGAKLFYPDGTIQHAGIILGYCRVAGEIMKGLPNNHPGQMQRANLTHNLSAVTGACLAVEKKKFIQTNGFDSKNLKIAFNDVDLCLRLMNEGFNNLFTPFASLYHHESKSRGKEDTPEKLKRFESEINYMLNTWGKILGNDPNYNPNLSLNWQKQFELAFPPRKSIY